MKSSLSMLMLTKAMTMQPEPQSSDQIPSYEWQPILARSMRALSENPTCDRSNPDVQTIMHVCSHIPDAIQHLTKNFDGANESLKAGIISAFYDAPCPIPEALQIRIVGFAENCTAEQGNQAFDAAVLTLAYCGQVRGRAIEVLSRCLGSDCWWHRGNAAISLAMLGVPDEAMIHRIGGLILDEEGGMDWTVCSSALRAIAIIGMRAHCLLPVLHQFAEGINAGDQCQGCDAELLSKAFEAIGDTSTTTVDILVRMVRKYGRHVPWHAMLALSSIAEKATLGDRTETAMQALARYACDEDAMEYLDEWADLLQISMITIGGAEHPESRRIRAFLRSIHWLDQDRHIKPFTHIFGED